MSALFCIHGHFYQPDREHPWLESVEPQDSAAPARDWNERVLAECYAANAVARILDERGRIVRLVNNYEKISFNFGPTLLKWLQQHAPRVYAAIIQADRTSLLAHGFGNAVAQAYNHPILPLASRRDKVTQVRWAIADFARRFGRAPEGMWLPETAVDRETLSVLAEAGIRFTVLAPHQAARVRAAPDGEWVEIGPTVLDTTRPYVCRPAKGLEIALFFYDGPAAQEIAFGRLLDSGEALADRLLASDAAAPWVSGRLVHVATDGETYGHHHQFGEMALAYAIGVLESRAGDEMTNYATFLADHPPTHEVEIHERTSWSCAHGVERWRSDCGCRTRDDWHQRWRRPLREALDWLKDELDTLFQEAGRRVFDDPWAARDGYIDVVLERTDRSISRFLGTYALRPRERDDRLAALRLLEMQRHAMLMFASDGWFFDDISGVETVQNLRHAARALQLASVFGRHLEPAFVTRLGAAESNAPAFGTGEAVYDRMVRPAVVDRPRIAAHAAMLSLFQDVPDETEVYAYRVSRHQTLRSAYGAHVLIAGRMEVAEAATGDTELLSYAVLHFGGTNVHCRVASEWPDGAHASAIDTLRSVCDGGTVAEVLRSMDTLFDPHVYSLRDLFSSERQAVLARLSETTMAHIADSYRRLYLESRALMKSLRDADVPVPREFLTAAEFVVTADLRRMLAAPAPLTEAAWTVLAEARSWGISLPADLEPALRARIGRLVRGADGLDLAATLREVERSLDFAGDAGIQVELWEAQNLFVDRLAPRLADAPVDERRALESVAERLLFNLESLRAP